MRIIKSIHRRNYAPEKRDVYGTNALDRQIVKSCLIDIFMILLTLIYKFKNLKNVK